MQTQGAPLFIIGSGRSGTTLLYHMLAAHEELGWFSSWFVRLPTLPQLGIFSRFQTYPLVDRVTRQIPKWAIPSEAIDFWEHYVPGYRTTADDWTAAHLSPAQAERLHQVIATYLAWQGKPRLLAKRTGLPMFGFLKALYPDAALVYIYRDARAVVMSRLKQKWGFKKNPEQLEQMPMQQRLDVYIRQYRHEFGAYLAVKDQCAHFSVGYETLLENPRQTITALCQHAHLDASSAFMDKIAAWNIQHEAKDAWKKRLNADEQAYLTAQLAEPLHYYGYGLG